MFTVVVVPLTSKFPAILTVPSVIVRVFASPLAIVQPLPNVKSLPVTVKSPLTSVVAA